MSFLTTIPAELLSAAAQLEGIGNSLTAQNAGAAAPTTALAPAAADPVSALQATIFSSYGTLYQQLAAEAQAIQHQFTSTLGLSADTYTETEAANVAAATPIDGILNQISGLLGGPSGSLLGQPASLSGNFGNFLNIGGGNWAAAASDLLGMAGGGLLPSDAGDAAAAAGDAAGAANLAGTSTPVGVGAMPIAGVGQAALVGRLSATPSWAGSFVQTTPVTNAAVHTVGWTAPATPQTGAPVAAMPGMPGAAAAAKGSALGAPRYGVKPVVMPKPTAV